MVGADVPGGPSPARTRRDVRQPSRARAWGAGGRAGRAPLPMWGHCAPEPTWGPVRTPRAEGGAGTSRAGPWVGCGPGRGREDMGPCRTRPRQARPSRVAEVQETRDFTSEQFRSEIPHHQTHGGSVAGLRSAQKIKRESARARACVCVWGGGDCGRGRRPRRPAPGAERCGAAHCVGSGGRARRAPLPMSVPFHCAPRQGHCAPEPTNVGDPCGRPAPRVARIHRTPGERSCAGVIETRNRSAWATLRFGANKFNHLSICTREGPLTGFLSLFYIF